MADICWNDESLDDLLSEDIGEIREMLAYEDAHKTFYDFLVENGYIDDHEDDEDWDEDEEDDFEEDESEDDDTELPSEEAEDLANRIADDISEGRYTLDSISGLYDTQFIDRVKQLIY